MSKKTSYKILVIDDEPCFCQMIQEFLTSKYNVLTSFDAKNGIQIAQQELPDLIILDLNMPVISGYDVCKNLRTHPLTKDIPVIIASGESDRDSQTEAYSIGADDFLTKPFTGKEILARVSSKIRRISEAHLAADNIICGNLTLNTIKHELTIAGETIEVSLTEANLIKCLIQYKDRVLTRQQILKDVWKDTNVSSRTIDSHIVSLRKKMKNFNYQVSSVYGLGYALKLKTMNHENEQLQP